MPVKNSGSKKHLRKSNSGIITMSHRPDFNNSIAGKPLNRNASKGVVTMSSPHGLKSNRIKSGKRRSSAMSHHSMDSINRAAM